MLGNKIYVPNCMRNKNRNNILQDKDSDKEDSNIVVSNFTIEQIKQVEKV